MAVPKKRQTHGRTRRRRAGHKKLTATTLTNCPKCGSLVKPHHLCSNCGYYKGQQIVDVTAKLEKKAKKQKEKELKEAGVAEEKEPKTEKKEKDEEKK